MRIAITGSTGRLGKALVRHFQSAPNCSVIALPRSDFDLADTNTLEKNIATVDCDILVNPAAITNVDLCESEHKLARNVNEKAPKILAKHCKNIAAKFIHISTDYVFDGHNEGLRDEGDSAVPLGVYGKSKLDGEFAALSVSDDFYVMRTSWVFGPDRPSFIDWIITEAKLGNELKAVGDKFSSPSYTLDFSRYLESFISKKPSGGIYHLCNSGTCSWQSFGQEAINYLLDHNYSLKSNMIEEISVEKIPQFIAQRPIHTALSTAKISKVLGAQPRAWERALHDYLDDHYLKNK